MNTQEKQELLETITSLPEAAKRYVYGYAAGVMDAMNQPDPNAIGPGPDRTAEQDNLSDSQTPAQAAPTNLTSMN